jgi:cytochrome P450
MAHAIPTLDTDIFSAEAVRQARAVDDAVRELAPVVRLDREDIVVIGRFSHVSAALSDWRSFSSRSRPWHDPTSVRPEILLTDDPPRHTEVRVVIANALSPKALNRMSQAFAKEAELVVERVLSSGGEFDAVAAICRPFVYKVLPDLLGLPVAWSRTHGSLRSHGVGDDGSDERVVPGGDGRQRAGAGVGRRVLQP